VDRVITGSGLIEHHQKDKADRGEARVENLNELVSAARGYEPEGELAPLQSFLAHAVLESGEAQGGEFEDCVQMMTLHSAKGLEFPLVFLCGMEDGLFPHQRSQSDLEGLEEERRLCYVGMTRAMRALYFTYAEQRRLHGADTYNAPSRFLGEVPAAMIEEVRPRIRVSQRPPELGRFEAAGGMGGARAARAGSGSRSVLGEALEGGMRLGCRVRHGKFGEGVVLTIEGQGPHARVQVNFERQGSKWLMLQYANLQVV
jgi:DNA helicase II / ATP-dependent DNA helicase PcrA